MSIAEKYAVYSGVYKRVLVLGADMVGKTSLINSVITNNFTAEYSPTTLADVYTDVDRCLQYIDIAGFTNSTYAGSWVQLNQDVIMKQILSGDSSSYFKGADIHAVDAYLIVYCDDPATLEIAKALRLSLAWKEYRGNQKKPRVFVVKNRTEKSVVRPGESDFEKGKDDIELTKIKLTRVTEKKKKAEIERIKNSEVDFSSSHYRQNQYTTEDLGLVRVSNGESVAKIFDTIQNKLQGKESTDTGAGGEAGAGGAGSSIQRGASNKSVGSNQSDRKCQVPDVEAFGCTIS